MAKTKFTTSTMMAAPAAREEEEKTTEQQIEESKFPEEIVPEKVEAKQEAAKEEVKEDATQDDGLDFKIGEEIPEQIQDIPVSDWKTALKTAPKEELLKELGLEWTLGLDDFDKEFSTFRKNGGDPYQYLQAKAFDWNKISDDDVLLMDFKGKYPNLTPEEQNYLFKKKYGIDDLDGEDEVKVKNIEKKAAAHEIRQREIENQKKFNIPVNQKQSVTKEALIEELSKEQIAQAEQIKQMVLNHPSTKSLIESKRVAIDAGELGSFKFGLDNPKVLVDFMNDANTYKKYTSNEKGEPDMEKAYISALLNVVGVKNFVTRIANYGKQMALKQIVEEGRNPSKKPASIAMQTEKQVWRQGHGIS